MVFELRKGESVPVEFRRRKGTRYLRLSVGHVNQIVVSVPWHCSKRDALGFVRKHRAWLRMQLASVPRTRLLGQWLEEYPQLTASGDVFGVRIEPAMKRGCEYTFDEGGAVVVLRIPLIEDKEEALQHVVRVFARDALLCRTAYHAKKTGMKFGKFSVRDQSSRWGSCSSDRSISLNWRLVLLPPALQDYVILHELAHLKELNHSKRYWDLLDRYDPDRLRHEAELDAVTPALMRVGRKKIPAALPV